MVVAITISVVLGTVFPFHCQEYIVNQICDDTTSNTCNRRNSRIKCAKVLYAYENCQHIKCFKKQASRSVLLQKTSKKPVKPVFVLTLSLKI